MTVQMKRRLRTMNRNIEKNTPRIKRRLLKLGARADGPIVVSLAKYYTTLNKLAKE